MNGLTIVEYMFSFIFSISPMADVNFFMFKGGTNMPLCSRPAHSLTMNCSDGAGGWKVYTLVEGLRYSVGQDATPLGDGEMPKWQ